MDGESEDVDVGGGGGGVLCSVESGEKTTSHGYLVTPLVGGD